MIVVLDAAAKGDELEFASAMHAFIMRDLGKGSGAARNLEIDLSLGHYIAFLDHDDWFEPNKLERQISAMLEARSLFSHTSYFAVYPTRREGRAVIGSGKFSGRVFPQIMQHCPVAMPTVMIHRSIAERGFRFGAGHLGADGVPYGWASPPNMSCSGFPSRSPLSNGPISRRSLTLQSL